ncbi:hypothetical protein M9H77_08674 [Catharanthus roseus]|uniref:Uncharacterized protein n=1 Tax=Catharanthus roseus TaxID=4058 RepID=A0ACC0BYN0_CATRO|nr:hypothetical protein M9H77_08674 [Catharanthus roseus]
MDNVRCLLVSSSVPKPFWGEAVSTAVYLINRSPSTTINVRTPIELWCGKPPNLSNLRVFGYAAFAHQKEGKLDPMSRKGVFTGYPSGVKGYRVWLKGEPGVRVIISKDIIFNELEMSCLKDKPNSDSPLSVPTPSSILVEVEVTSEPSLESPLEPETNPELPAPSSSTPDPPSIPINP